VLAKASIIAAAEQSKVRETCEGQPIQKWLETILRQKGGEILEAEWDT
jgi:hypothetical protein